ncbi:MAG: DNA alkylation repair protein [Nanoarchaeota archaeon]
MLRELIKEINSKKNIEKARIYRRFFKTGKGEYGEGDIFIGLSMLEQRKIAKKFINLGFDDIGKLLYSKYHEYRMIGFIIIVYKFENSNDIERKYIVNFYLENISQANNWDLIDCVCDKILGKWLIDKDKNLLYEFSKSENLWKRRIAIISTFYFIKNNKFNYSLDISKILLNDKHDLIHKAVGWMLREIGKRDKEILKEFLKKYYRQMPRTMLRYAIEKFKEDERKKYLNGKI